MLAPCQAHPHSRWENSTNASMICPAIGSSPLTRGKRQKVHARNPGVGLIPAHAGKTLPLGATLPGRTAHPRSCGENIDAWELPERHVGSSPLTRGKQSEGTGAFTHHGLIPAHAGKTSRPRSRLAVPRAHPRSHWENDVSTASSRQSSGLSPLTEGKLLGCDRDCGQLRLTPAHAGKTARGRGRRRTQRAHPRTCGENMAMPRNVRSRTGSSPLTRGKHRDLRRIEREAGLIPTHAGKTFRRAGRCSSHRAHLRSRRENHLMPQPIDLSAGSSPLTRGKLDV